jgi:hypothetical protein
MLRKAFIGVLIVVFVAAAAVAVVYVKFPED